MVPSAFCCCLLHKSHKRYNIIISICISACAIACRGVDGSAFVRKFLAGSVLLGGGGGGEAIGESRKMNG